MNEELYRAGWRDGYEGNGCRYTGADYRHGYQDGARDRSDVASIGAA